MNILKNGCTLYAHARTNQILMKILNVLKEWIYFTYPSLNQLDHYEYNKRMDVFHMLMLKGTISF